MLGVCLILTTVVSCSYGTAAGFTRMTTISSTLNAVSSDDSQLKAYAESHGLFTSWFSGDATPSYSTGDFEGVTKTLEKNTASDCKLWCDQPAGVEWKLNDATFDSRIGVCIELDIGMISGNTASTSTAYPGFTCLNSDQMDSSCASDQNECNEIGMKKGSKRMEINCDHCPDFQVRYMCNEARVASAPCPGVSKRGLLLDAMQALDERITADEREVEELTDKVVQARNRSLTHESSESKAHKLQSLLALLLEQD